MNLPHRPRQVAALAGQDFANRQLQLFQGLLANSPDEREALSNTVDLWDSIPRYTVSRARMNAMRTPQGFLSVLELGFNYRGRALVVRIHPVQVKGEDGKWLSFYPSAREELVEHALRKLAAEQNAGFFDSSSQRSGVRFSLYQLRAELASQGHSLRYRDLIEALDILSMSNIEIEGVNESGEAAFTRSTCLAALSGVKRSDYDADPAMRWVAQFHPLVTRSIDQVSYRQFNYQRLMRCRTQLARWLIGQLVLKFTQAAWGNSFEMRLSTIRRDSALLDGYARERQGVAAVDEAWAELTVLGALSQVSRFERRGARAKLLDVVYTVQPSQEFAAEQRAANRRLVDAGQRPRPVWRGTEEPCPVSAHAWIEGGRLS